MKDCTSLSPSTYVLTHTSQGAIGFTTRIDESLEEFQRTIPAEPKLTNLGIMKSPGTGSMILSMYHPLLRIRSASVMWEPESMPAG